MLMRYSGLPNNATLEMCVATKKRTESSVIVLVQLEDGTRLTGSFTPSGELYYLTILAHYWFSQTLCGR